MLVQDHSLPLESLLPIRSIIVTLQFTRTVKPRLFHQPALSAFLRFLAGSPEHFDQFIRIDTPESGHIAYQAGDYYRFMLLGFGGDTQILEHLFIKLQQLPRSTPKQGKALPFSSHWKFVQMQDALSEQSIHQFAEISHYGLTDLNNEVAIWRLKQCIHWRFLAPARLLKAQDQRKNLKGEVRYIRNQNELTGHLLLQRIHNSLADLIRRRESCQTEPSYPPDFPLLDQHLFWMDCEYTNAKGKHNVMGGVSGRFTLDLSTQLNTTWWQLLILGQYIGIGQRASFGWGRYQLQTEEGLFSYRHAMAASSVIMRAQKEENLSSAWRHVMSGRGEPQELTELEEEALDDTKNIQTSEAPIAQLQQDLDQLLQGEYSIPTLRGYLIPKSNGGVRPLAVPPIYDRVMQRAISQIISPALEQLMYRHSHGFRKGRSRITASYEIQAAWREGYRWVYESDIKDFFDSVSLNALYDRLSALYYGDPIVERIIAWMQADVVFQKQSIERNNGLPQGSPLSPLMANLMLDDFDSDMQAAGFFLIRFADDFIVLCKDPQQAKKAGELAIQSLQEHGFVLHPDKTQITALQDGFKYLGYLFMNDMVLDVSNKNPKEQDKVSVPAHSWLAHLADKEPQRITQTQSLDDLLKCFANKQSIEVAERDKTGTLLAVTGEYSVMSTDNKQMQVHRDDKRLYRLPWKSLQTIILFGNHQITTQAMHAALRHNVNIHLATRSGRYQGVVTHNRNSQHQQTWLRQTATFSDNEKALYCAQEIVKSRLQQMKKHLYQRRKAYRSPVLDKAIQVMGKVDSLASLLGHEGSATREYYQCLALSLPPEYNFSGRNRRPPRDPVNVLFSLGYTLLYAYTESLIHGVGLLPWQGFYHQARGKHAALASDLMEPFRHLIERTAISLINRHEIKQDDFSYTVAGACLISDSARRQYIALLLQRFDTKIKARGQTEAQSWLYHMQQQVLSLKAFVDHGSVFKAFRL
ncbi:MAG: CRISPR-associated endonuclease Cas1 [Thiotrichaceae bacterium]|nr:CRISPR-associated endonuclease Cas1 [Thiotrichaceae bacterium]